MTQNKGPLKESLNPGSTAEASRKSNARGFNIKRKAYELWLAGVTHERIAQRLKIHPRTVSRWIKSMQDVQIEVTEERYEKFIYELLEDLDETIKFLRIVAIRAVVAGDMRTSYSALQTVISAEKRRERTLDRAGLKFKSDVENENVELKMLCGWCLCVISNLENYYFDHVDADDPPEKCPYNVTMEEILEMRSCPEMFKINTHFAEYKIPKGHGYVTRFELEIIQTIRALNDDLLGFGTEN